MELKRRDSADGNEEKINSPAPENAQSDKSAKKREASVIIYTSILFLVALALILLSYFIQQRTTTKLTEVTTQHGEFSELALQNIVGLQNKNQELTNELDKAREELEAREEELESAQASLEQMTAEIAGLEQGAAAAKIETEALQSELETQRKKTEAVGLLAALLASQKGEDTSAIIDQLDALKEYLDGAYLTIYNSYIENN